MRGSTKTISSLDKIENTFTIPLPKYGIGDAIYYNNLEGSMLGHIHNASYNLLDCKWYYRVCFGPLTGDYTLIDEQISKTKKL